MSPIPIFIGPDEKAKLVDLVARAAASPTDYWTLLALVAATEQGHGAKVAEMNKALTVEIPVGFTVTLTYEEQRPGVMCRHASIGVRTTPGRAPSPEAVTMIMTELGFVNSLGRLPTYMEYPPDGTGVINLIEPLDGDMRRLAK